MILWLAWFSNSTKRVKGCITVSVYSAPFIVLFWSFITTHQNILYWNSWLNTDFRGGGLFVHFDPWFSKLDKVERSKMYPRFSEMDKASGSGQKVPTSATFRYVIFLPTVHFNTCFFNGRSGWWQKVGCPASPYIKKQWLK